MKSKDTTEHLSSHISICSDVEKSKISKKSENENSFFERSEICDKYSYLDPSIETSHSLLTSAQSVTCEISKKLPDSDKESEICLVPKQKLFDLHEVIFKTEDSICSKMFEDIPNSSFQSLTSDGQGLPASCF